MDTHVMPARHFWPYHVMLPTECSLKLAWERMYAIRQGYASANITEEQKRTLYAIASLPGG